MVMGYGRNLKEQIMVTKKLEIVIWESGGITKLMDLEFTNGPMEISMKESGNNVENMEKELIFLQTEINTLVSIKMVSRMGEESMFGRMEVIMRGSLEKD